MENFQYYIALLVALIIGIFLIKKVASCLFRTVVTVVLLIIFVAVLYYLGYF